MKWIAYARTPDDLQTLKEAGAAEVILCHPSLSRMGSFNDAEVKDLAKKARAIGLRPLLDWDILMTDPVLKKALSIIKDLDLAEFDAIRVQDPAAYEYLLQHPAQPKLHLVLETGNHNFEALRRWCEYGGDRVERIAVSVQTPKNVLEQHIQKLGVPVEMLGLGPVLLLYTPRHLLSNQKNDFDWLKDESEIARHFAEATASSEESFHSGFRVIENAHGTLVHHPKDYCLADQLPELMRIGLAAFRVDYRLEKGDLRARYLEIRNLFDLARSNSPEFPGRAQNFIESHPNKVTRCFFQANATDVLFKKLKNTKIQRQDSGYIGEVAEISRNSHLIVHVLGKNAVLRKGQTIRFINPEGAVYEHSVDQIRNLDQNEVNEIGCGDFAVLPYLKLVTPKSAVYLQTISISQPV